MTAAGAASYTKNLDKAVNSVGIQRSGRLSTARAQLRAKINRAEPVMRQPAQCIPRSLAPRIMSLEIEQSRTADGDVASIVIPYRAPVTTLEKTESHRA